jgi:hypothetical protein
MHNELFNPIDIFTYWHSKVWSIASKAWCGAVW